MRVCVDGRNLVDGSGRGIANYISALLPALGAAYPGDEWVVTVPSGGAAAVPDGVASRLPAKLLYAAGAVTGRPRLDVLAGGADVFWAPAPAPLAVSSRVPSVVTVHDRTWEVRPADFTRYERLWHRMARIPRLVRGAAQVITTTEHGRADAIAAWGLDPARVTAVPLAPVAVPRGAEAVRGRALPARYVLFVGALEPRKGPDVLARAYADARARGLDAGLVVVGSGRADALLREPGVIAAGRVGAAELSALYAGALALVAPSYLEGYGLPAVEALAHGTPVITSDLPPVREVLGGGARYVPPGDARALADALLGLAGDASARAELAAAGAAATAALSWERTAHATRAVLARAAEGV